MSQLDNYNFESAIDREGGVDAYRDNLGRRAGQQSPASTKTKSQNLYEMIATPKRQQTHMRFPEDLGFEGSDNVIRFNVNVPSGSKYLGAEGGNPVTDAEGNQVTSVRRESNSNSLTRRFSGNVVRTDTVIDLFLPTSIQTQYSSTWNTEHLGTTGAAIEAGYGLAEIRSMEDTKDTLATAARTAVASMTGVMSKTVDMIARTNTDGARRMITSMAVNPYMEVLFEGINPRTFSFTFKMIPKNAYEQETIKNIVNTFKFHQAPEVKFEEQTNYWLFPSEFDISFLYQGQDNPWIHKISTCALTNLQVEYTAEGQYTSHSDGSPFSTTITLEFTEMELLTKSRILEGY